MTTLEQKGSALTPRTTALNTGWLSFAGTGSFSSEGAGEAWNQPERALTLDEDRTGSLNVTGSQSAQLTAQELVATGISSTSTILGVEVRAMRQAAGNVVDCTDVQLIIGGSPSGDNKSWGQTWKAVSDRYDHFGGDGELWGLNLTPAIINAADFGFMLACDLPVAFASSANVNIMQMRIFYEL